MRAFRFQCRLNSTNVSGDSPGVQPNSQLIGNDDGASDNSAAPLMDVEKRAFLWAFAGSRSVELRPEQVDQNLIRMHALWIAKCASNSAVFENESE